MALTGSSFGRSEVPAEVRAHLGRDKVLAHARADAAWLVGTRDRLLLVPDDGPVRTIPWQEVDRAGWEVDERVLQVSEVGRWGDPRATHRFRFTEKADAGPVRLLQLVRERVTASIVLQRRVPVDGRRGLTVHGRRPPSGGEVTWLVQYDEGLDPADERVSTLADAAVTAAEAEV